MGSNDACTEKQLNCDQQAVYKKIVKWLGEKKVILFDAPSGTGKTFILSILAARFHDKQVQFIVFRRDQASKLSLQNIDTYTYVSYIMRNFSLEYHKVLDMFSMKKCKNNIDVLYKLITYLKNFTFVSNVIEIIIVDTYSITSPIMLLFLYLVSVKNNIQLIFSGNILQQSAIPRSPFHNRNNFYIVKTLCDKTVNKLTKNMRLCDANFNDKLLRLGEMIENYRPEGEIPLYFNFRYLLYCLFRSKYFTEECFNTLYMAHCHHEITSRLNRFINHLKDIKKSYIIEPFYLSREKVIHQYPADKKFFPGLLLVIGCKYVHITKQGIHEIVCLEGMNYKNNELESLVVRSVNNEFSGEKEIQRSYLNYYQILPAYRHWILTNFRVNDQLWQFPLRIFMLTYHAALGCTISDNVELSANFANANSLYTGLCCITHESAIHKIYDDKNLLSLRVTEYMENELGDKEFYYRWPLNVQNCDNISEFLFETGELIKEITWCTVNSIQDFENKKLNKYLRIKRSMYEQSQKVKDKTTSLMQVTEFIKHNKSVIPATIQKISDENSSKAINNKKLKKDTTKSKAYIFLKDAYTNWITDNKETKK